MGEDDRRATALLVLVLIGYQYGNQPSLLDMGLAAELGAAARRSLSPGLFE